MIYHDISMDQNNQTWERLRTDLPMIYQCVLAGSKSHLAASGLIKVGKVPPPARVNWDQLGESLLDEGYHGDTHHVTRIQLVASSYMGVSENRLNPIVPNGFADH